jgi:hypothetical protein
LVSLLVFIAFTNALPLSRIDAPVSPNGLFFLAFQTSTNIKRCALMVSVSLCMDCVIKETVLMLKNQLPNARFWTFWRMP